MAGILPDTEAKPSGPVGTAPPPDPWRRVPWLHLAEPAEVKSVGGRPQNPLLAPLYELLKSVMGSRRAIETIAEVRYPDDPAFAGPDNVKKQIQRERKRRYGILSVIPKRFYLDD